MDERFYARHTVFTLHVLATTMAYRVLTGPPCCHTLDSADNGTVTKPSAFNIPQATLVTKGQILVRLPPQTCIPLGRGEQCDWRMVCAL